MKNCIYTVIINKYDELPVIKTKKNNNWEYFCITDDENLKSDDWKIIYVENNNPNINKLSKNIFNIKLSRYYKTNFSDHFNEFENIIYLDARFKIIGDINEYLTKLKNFDIVLLKHPSANNILKEMDRVLLGKLESKEMVEKIRERYKQENYNYNNGLFAGGVLLFKNNEVVKKFFKCWWNEINEFSHRDQLSLNFALSKVPEIKINILDFNNILSNYFIQQPRKTKRIQH